MGVTQGEVDMEECSVVTGVCYVAGSSLRVGIEAIPGSHILVGVLDRGPSQTVMVSGPVDRKELLRILTSRLRADSKGSRIEIEFEKSIARMRAERANS